MSSQMNVCEREATGPWCLEALRWPPGFKQVTTDNRSSCERAPPPAAISGAPPLAAI